MKHHGLVNVRYVLGVLLAVPLCVPARADDPAAEAAAAAVREFDALAPSVEQCVKDLIEVVKRYNLEYKSQPAVEWATEYRKPKKFVDVDEDRLVSWDTEVVYTVTAIDRKYDYQLKRIAKIVRTGQRETPFSAAVEIEVTFADRIVEVERVIPIPVPKGFREATDEDEGLAIVMEVEEADEPSYGLFVMPRFPIDHHPYVRWDVDSAPEPVQDLVAKLGDRCQKAKPAKSHEIQTVTLFYSFSERKWNRAKLSREIGG
jgi:hypothetical protein